MTDSSSENSPLDAERSRLSSLRDRLSFQDATDRVLAIQNHSALLSQQVQALRRRGYAFRSGLEVELGVLRSDWETLHATLEQALADRRRILDEQVRRIQASHDRTQSVAAALDDLESSVRSGEESLGATCAPLEGRLGHAQETIERIELTLRHADQKSFEWQAGEGPVQAVPSNWKKPGDKDGVEGVLFLTDKRLLFEQKEEVATKKVLFITTEKKTVQGLQWAVDVGQIASAEGSRRGLLGRDDYLTVRLGPGSPFPAADIHLRGQTGETWRELIEQARSGAIVRERVGTPLGLTLRWAARAPILVRTIEGAARLKAFGSCSVAIRRKGLVEAGAGLPAEVAAKATGFVVAAVTDVVGAAALSRAEHQLTALREELGDQARTQATDQLAALGLELLRVDIESLAAEPA